MGSWCSSPMRRFGGKQKSNKQGADNTAKGTTTRRDSISEIIDNNNNENDNDNDNSNDNPEQLNIAANIDSEITIQSEANEEQASSASYYTDVCQQQREQEQQQQQQAPATSSCSSRNQTTVPNTISAASAAARIMSPNSIPCDRHLLVSPALSSASYQQASKQKIFTIKENHRHVIAIYPDKNSLAVWDIYDERAVRIINDIDHPRDLRMIDQKRAVILCNRELRVYDLDQGNLLIKLKGVMNQKMPYFEVFGQDYVIALARNRMYVNMLNINTGELETTFKVGEDRFLNSLLVSADGGICVCGDETQKPFPLLVWNLNERRLMYDLRLERHEFITRMSAISDDGHFVVSVCKQLNDNNNNNSNNNNNNNTNESTTSTPAAAGSGPTTTTTNQQQQLLNPPANNSSAAVAVAAATAAAAANSSCQKTTAPNFIVIYDLTSGTLFKKWKPGLDTCGVAICLSANRSGKLINSIIDNSILVWDLTTGSKRHTLIGHSTPADVIKVQNNRLFSMDSTCRDQSLRIWDIEEGYCLAVFSPDAPISCCEMSIRGDALICGFATEFRLSTLFMSKNDTTTTAAAAPAPANDVVKKSGKRRKSAKSLYIFDEPPPSRKTSS